MKNLIVAHAAEGVIGNNGGIPWQGKMREDMRRFRERTTGHAVIMGRLTCNSLKGPLPDRQNIVISRTVTKIAGFDVVPSLDLAYEAAQGQQETFIIGGAQVYTEALPNVDRMFITKIDAKFDGDTHFVVDLENEEWVITDKELWARDSANHYPCVFETYRRVANV